MLWVLCLHSLCFGLAVFVLVFIVLFMVSFCVVGFDLIVPAG